MSNPAIEDLRRQMDYFRDNLWAWSGYFPSDFHGKLGEQYYKWSKKTYDILRKIDLEAEVSDG